MDGNVGGDGAERSQRSKTLAFQYHASGHPEIDQGDGRTGGEHPTVFFSQQRVLQHIHPIQLDRPPSKGAGDAPLMDRGVVKRLGQGNDRFRPPDVPFGDGKRQMVNPDGSGEPSVSHPQPIGRPHVGWFRPHPNLCRGDSFGNAGEPVVME